ncbi:protein nirF [Cupriavidus pauculus]|uniref:Protein nirF n=1 Tax=Cupriavidus pauculus TaxID=82633 RepID=A0A3G8H1E5_9BURK|nr:cytochrome D1 domain-containing protein [Cupriavidus pauculus]AZG13302.1 protein nirF [Cupriavidus pauculus]
MADRSTPGGQAAARDPRTVWQRLGRLTRRAAVAVGAAWLAAACTGLPEASVRGTGDLGVVIERASGRVQIVETTGMTRLGAIDGLGDLSHASVVFARDGRHAYVFGRDGGLTRLDLLAQRITHRVKQAGNSIGGAVLQDGKVVAAQNYAPGGIKLFDAGTLELLADIPAIGRDGRRSKVVGLADLPGQRLAASLFESGEIWIIDATNPRQPAVSRLPAGREPYDGLVTPDGRWYLAGLFGEDGLSLVDLWQTPPAARRVLAGYGRGQAPLPVYKMPHLRGWAMAQGQAWLPAIGRHELLVADPARDWQEQARVAVAGQPVFAMARPDGRQVWVNFAFPRNDTVQVVDTATRQVVRTMTPCRGVLHMEFTPKGEALWLSCRDDNRVEVYDTATLRRIATLPAEQPSGIFFTARAQRFGM